MALPTALLLLLGFTLGPATDAATYIITQPILWADPESLQEPWANLTLTCEARLATNDFQLLMNGQFMELAHVDIPTVSYQFTLGTITSANRGLYRCQSVLDDSGRWTQMSNLVEVTGTEPLPRPLLAAQPVPWITPGLRTTLLCQASLRGVTFLLRREGDDGFLEVANAGEKGQASFPVNQPGNYTCSYRTHDAGDPSEPSAAVTIEEYVIPPQPELTFPGHYPKLLQENACGTLVCVAPLTGIQIELRHGEQPLRVPTYSTTPGQANFCVSLSDLGDQSNFTCRYRLHTNTAWSKDSKPKMLMWSDETLPAPVLTAEPSSQILEAGSMVQLRCTAPKAGLRFGLLHEAPGGQSLLQILMPSGNEAVFQLHKISAIDSANYSCIYMELVPPFSGSAPSNLVSLTVNGPLPRPKLQAHWTGKVPAGRDAVFRCQSDIPKVTIELLREGSLVPSIMFRILGTSTDLVLPFVGPQHVGNYSCRYTSWWPMDIQSELSNPVELLVEGS